MPSSVRFAALLTYSPRGTSEISKKSRDVCYAIKRGQEDIVRRAVARLVEVWDGAGMAAFFGGDVTLVPVPRSAPLVQGALWPAEVICREIVRQGLARTIDPVLRRVTAVPKSSTARPGERPDVEKHLKSMEAEARLSAGRITVVDDVITKGRMLYAAVGRVQEAAPTVIVVGFALVRTMSFIEDVEQIVHPAVGTVTSDGWGDVYRDP